MANGIKAGRRGFMKAAGAGALLSVPMINLGYYRLGASDRTYSARSVAIVERAMVLDMLAIPKIDFRPEVPARPMTDREKAEFRASGITGIQNAVGIGGPRAKEQALEFLAAWQGYAGRNSDVFSLVGLVSDLERAKAEGKVGMIMGLQNADQFERATDVKFFYDLGLRCAQLTYNSLNRIGSGATERVDAGVSDFGVSIIGAMNDVGMLIDVSHSGDRTTLDAVELSPRPIAFTHSNCRALNEHPRNKTDEMIVKLAAKGGVMGITGVRNFISNRDPTTIVDYVDHIEHVVKLVGIEHVGIGSDSDLNGYDDMPADQNAMLRNAYKDSYAFRDKIDVDGFDHPRKVFDLVEEMIRRGYSDDSIELVLGGNFARLLRATWK
ncbi:membrane dipeptidase [Qipengyuania sp. DY56-A-20]|jgi:membrane dipeptidase|uniref:Membrane dipeptidase n=1 Tax=Qipengyuania benthica TaxID=3067651 RepID=A0ABT9H9M1_9SPHN|nr:membrane dipeptidase [Qipengyuania sp. DY56-A-20]MDP4540018.1 membrane dipeptidase [Qipengyuania sp. DY56-A-20]